MLENIQLCKYVMPTPIQRYCIPAILEGRDLLSCAQTGKYPHPCRSRSQSKKKANHHRIRKDGCFLDPDPIQADGQGKEARSSSPEAL